MGHGHATRRNVLAGALAAAAAATLSPPFGVALAQGPLRKRRNIEALGPDELRAYEHAIKVLKDRSAANPADPTGYDHWAALHDDFDVSNHSGCAHFSEKFLPWHRRLLHDFELALQQADPSVTANVTIPYWDWSVRTTSGVLFPAPFENSASPLHVQRFKKNPPPWDADDLRGLVRDPDWNLFAGKPDASDGFGTNPGTLESGPHNTLHGNISAFMAEPSTAVQDPIFWSFHAGIDLAWARWQRLHIAPGGSQPFRDPAAVIWFQDRSYAVGSTGSMTDFGYEYEYDYSADGPAAGSNNFFSAMAPVTSVTAAPRRVIRLNRRAGAAAEARLAIPVGGTPAAGALLRLADVRAFHDLTYRLQLYLHPAGVAIASLAPEARQAYHMRTLTLWRPHHDGRVEMFIRPSREQLANLQAGWIVTIRSEAATEDDTAVPSAPVMRRLRAGDLFGSIELQER